MLKAIAMLGALTALGGGTYVAVQRTCGTGGGDAVPASLVSSGEPCTACCPVEAAAAETVAAPCPAEEQDATTTASAAPAPAPEAAPQAN